MHDDDGPRIAQHFYAKLLSKQTIELDDIPYALDDAVCTLRMQGASLERWATFAHFGA
jgi:hypothetical protein